MQAIQIAIDGPSGAGKSTMAKIISKRLGILYLDTGSMYRAVALKAIRQGIDTRDRERVAALMPDIRIDISYVDGSQRVFLDGEDITGSIRTNDVSMGASNVSAFPEVRERLVELQRKIAENTGVIMDGRDIGTHVLPNADVKVFLTASVEERARRRFEELKEKGLLDKTLDELIEEIKTRDYNDSTRQHSPLRQAEDAILLDTSHLNIDQAVQRILEIIDRRTNDTCCTQ
jgi:cytidylate kinase